MSTIEVTVSPSGEINIETKGFSGRACLDATRQWEAALGRKTGDRLTSEFYALASQSAEERVTAHGDTA